jgi:hypothetical protein
MRRTTVTVAGWLAMITACCAGFDYGHSVVNLILLVPGVLLLAGILIQVRWTARRVVRWAGAGGWVRAEREGLRWPWEGLLLRGTVSYGAAWVREIDGLPVTWGGIKWTEGALSGAVPTREGQGVLVVVRLPKPVPGMAMRLPNHIVGASPLLDRPELRGAFESGEIPPWTVRVDELFIFEPHDSWTTVAVKTQAVARAVDRALSLVRLLDLAADDGESAVTESE